MVPETSDPGMKGRGGLTWYRPCGDCDERMTGEHGDEGMRGGGGGMHGCWDEGDRMGVGVGMRHAGIRHGDIGHARDTCLDL